MKVDEISVALVKAAFFLLLASLISGCSSGPEKSKPAQLSPLVDLIGVRLAWSTSIGPVDFPLEVKVSGDTVVVASTNGLVRAHDALTGASLWQAELGEEISTGFGTDGQRSAIITRENNLVVLDSGREIWRHKLSAQSFTAPLVAGGRVFLLTADRAVAAFDAQSGRKIWVQQRPGEALVLRQTGVLTTFGDLLIVGSGGRMVAMSPSNGVTRWEVPIASARGTNDVERLIDLTGVTARQGEIICARAFQAAIGCVNAAKGSLVWTKPATGSTGVAGDDRFVFGVEGNGKIIAWSRSEGDRVWTSDSLLQRTLTAPLVVGRSVAVGDETGLIHFLSREDGTSLARLPTDGSPVMSTPVVAGGVLVVVTRKGGIFGFKPE